MKNNAFTETGSGQAQGKLKQKGRVCHTGAVNCVETWELLPAAFPSGLRALSKQMNDMPWLLYAPYFCANTTLRSKFPDMLVSPTGYSVPSPQSSAKFYESLFAAKQVRNGRFVQFEY